jgi:hypothetical protein
LKQIKEKAAEWNVVVRDVYQLEKSMDVLKTAAGNQGGVRTGIIQTGIGVGMLVANQIGQQVGYVNVTALVGSRSTSARSYGIRASVSRHGILKYTVNFDRIGSTKAHECHHHN